VDTEVDGCQLPYRASLDQLAVPLSATLRTRWVTADRYEKVARVLTRSLLDFRDGLQASQLLG
jgi:hypothetical protein